MNESAIGNLERDPFRVLGSVVARHRILRLIGAGGMGAVYEGEHVELTARRALKFCRVHVNPTVKQRAVNEARIGASLRHPAICRVYDFEWGPPDGSTPVVVMELLQGRPLIDDMIKQRRLPWQDLFRIMAAVCDGLEAAHARGVVHRDVKPDNIFLTPSGPKIVDFGIAKLATARVTRTGMTLFTPLYASPEQITNSKDVDARSDVYSAGVILYHAISGQRMFPGRDGNGLILAVLRERPSPFRDVAPFAPGHVAAIVDRCIAKEPGHRYPSAAALKTALESSLHADGGPMDAVADARALTPPAETTTIPSGRDPAAPRELMATTPGKVAPHVIDLASPAEDPEPRTYSAAPAPIRPRSRTFAIVALVIVVIAGGSALVLRHGATRAPASVPAGTPAGSSIAAPAPGARSPIAPLERVAAPLGRVRIATTPPGASVVVAGRAIGRTPVEVRGARNQLVTVHLQLDGYSPRDEEVLPSAEGGEAQFSLRRFAPSLKVRRQTQQQHVDTRAHAADRPHPATPTPVSDENGPVDPFK